MEAAHLIEPESGVGVDFEVLCRAIESGDPDSILALYAEDAKVWVLNSTAPLFELNGKVEIFAYFRTVFGRQTNHRVSHAVVGRKRITFQDVCGYPDGTRVVVATTLEVRGGEILHHLDVVSHDDAPTDFTLSQGDTQRSILWSRGGHTECEERTPDSGGNREGGRVGGTIFRPLLRITPTEAATVTMEGSTRT